MATLKTEQINQTNEEFKLPMKKINEGIAAAVSSALCAAGRIMGYISPFNIVPAVLFSPINGLAAFFFSMIVYIFSGNEKSGAVNLLTIALLSLLKLFKPSVFEGKSAPARCAVISGASLAAFSTAAFLLLDESVSDYTFQIVSSLLGAAAVYFAMSVFIPFSEGRSVSSTQTGRVGVCFLYVCSVCVLSSFSFFDFTPGRSAGVFVILVVMMKLPKTAGAFTAVLTACGVIFCRPELSQNTVLLSIAALITGAAAAKSRFITSVVFLALNVVCSLAVGLNSDTFPFLIDIIVACAAFALIPEKALNKAVAKLNLIRLSNDANDNLSLRLSFASKMLDDVREQINGVSEAVERKKPKSEIRSDVCEKVCGSCRDNARCWATGYDYVQCAFALLEQKLRRDGFITVNTVCARLQGCRKKEELASEFNLAYEREAFENERAQKCTNLRELMTEQLSTTSDILDSLCCGLRDSSKVDSELTACLKTRLSEIGLVSVRPAVFRDTFGRLSVEIFAGVKEKLNPAVICCEASEAIGAELSLPVVTVADKLMRLEMSEKPSLKAFVGFYQVSGSPDEYCGDSYDELNIAEKEKYIMISDGMGTGKKARLNSLFAVTLASRLITAGFSPSASLRLINSIIRVKGWDESFSTFDLVHINLSSGELSVLKAGAAPSYVYSGGKLSKLEMSSLPLGIFTAPEYACASVKIQSGDIVIMLTDGAESITSKLTQLISDNRKCSPEELAQILVDAASESDSPRRDDITASVIKIC